MTTYTATYSPDDNKLRLYASARLDAETYARVKGAGFSWAPKQELFVAPMWTPAREDLLIDLAGAIDDEDSSLVERAEARADRFGEYSERRTDDAERAHKVVAEICEFIPLGQPILVGHHSEKRARKDVERIENGMRKAVRMWETADYWRGRAAGAIQAAKYKERPDVRARRIKTLEAEARKVERTKADAQKALSVWQKIASMDNDPEKQLTFARAFTGQTNYGNFKVIKPSESDHYGRTAYDVLLPDDQRAASCPAWTVAQVLEVALVAYDRPVAHCNRWLAHYANRLEYERAMLAEAGGMQADKFDIQPGGRVLVGSEWVVVIRLNKKDGKVISMRTSRRYVPIIGVEEVKDYRAPTVDEAEMVAKATKIAKLTNYPGEGFHHITSAQWEKINKDYKGTRNVEATAEHGKHRVRFAMGAFLGAKGDNERHRYAPVFITDAKRIDPPAPDGAPSKPVHFAREVEPPAPATAHQGEAPAGAEQVAAMKAALRDGVKAVAVPQLFPTPAEIAEQMAEAADIQPGHRILEPSAGTGNILRAIEGARGYVTDRDPACDIVAVEIDQRLAASMPQHLCGQVVSADFLECNGNLGMFDRIVMNPPFAPNGADIKHIKHAAGFLRPGGRLVAICADGPRQREQLKPLAAEWRELPPDTFKAAGTMVNTVLVVIDAP